MWQIIESGCLPPASVMAKDQSLLNQFETDLSHPILHFYEWEGDCLTYGYFTEPSAHLNLSAINKAKIRMARRPTGGGLIFHLTDFAFSVLVPAGHSAFSTNTLENYAYINRKVAQAIIEFTSSQTHPQLHVSCEKVSSGSFCMAKPTQYDLIVNHKKVGGAAQRRTKWGYLHQGTISLALPPIDLLNTLLKDKTVVTAMQQNTYPLLEEGWSPHILVQARQELKSLLKNVFI